MIVALDADFLCLGPRPVDAQAFASRREVEPDLRAFITGKPEPGESSMNRLYAIECTPTITGGSADHRLAVSAVDVEAMARAIAAAVNVGLAGAYSCPNGSLDTHNGSRPSAATLSGTKGRCVVLAGESQPPEVHALAHALNHALGNVGKTVEYLPRLDEGPADQTGSLRELADDINAGKVDTLLILGGNPAYDAPADLKFAEQLDGGQTPKVPLKIHLGPHQDETALLCQWHVPEAHAWKPGAMCEPSTARSTSSSR